MQQPDPRPYTSWEEIPNNVDLSDQQTITNIRAEQKSKYGIAVRHCLRQPRAFQVESVALLKMYSASSSQAAHRCRLAET